MSIPWQASSDDFDDLWEEHTLSVVPDMLTTMFAQQEKHLRDYSDIAPEMYLDTSLWGEVNDFKTQAALHENYGYIIRELSEAMEHLKNKPWKQTVVPVAREEFSEELADVWHFLIQFMILAGLSPLDVFKGYFTKALINQHRRDTGD
jgi:hypothetical protein